MFWGYHHLGKHPQTQSLPKKIQLLCSPHHPLASKTTSKFMISGQIFRHVPSFRTVIETPTILLQLENRHQRSKRQINESKRLQPPNVNNTPTVKTMYCFFNRIRPTQNDSYRQCHNATTTSRHGLPWLPTQVLAVGETLVGRSSNFVNLGG